jgi:hypothetical protein
MAHMPSAWLLGAFIGIPHTVHIDFSRLVVQNSGLPAHYSPASVPFIWRARVQSRPGRGHACGTPRCHRDQAAPRQFHRRQCRTPAAAFVQSARTSGIPVAHISAGVANPDAPTISKSHICRTTRQEVARLVPAADRMRQHM